MSITLDVIYSFVSFKVIERSNSRKLFFSLSNILYRVFLCFHLVFLI